MKNLKKILAMVLVVALCCAVSVGITVAYLTDEDEAHNVFTVGNIDIELDEEVKVEGAGSVSETKDEEGNSTGASYTGVMPGDWLQKEVTVTNTGANAAYVAVEVVLRNDTHDFALLLNKAIDDKYGDDNAQAYYDKIFQGWGLNHSKDLDGDGKNDAGMRLTITGEDMPEHVLQVDSLKTVDEYTLFYANNWFGEQKDIIPFDGYYTEGMDTYEFKYVYYLYLEPGETSVLFEGLKVPYEFDADQLAMFQNLHIDIEASAIQAAGFGSAKVAFETLANGGNVVGVIVDGQDAFDAAVAAGETVITLEPGEYHMPAAQRKTLTINGTKDSIINVIPGGQGEAGGQLDYSLDGSNVTFNGVTIKTNNATYAGYCRLSATYNDCTFINQYCLNGNSEFNNCTFNVSGDVYNVWTWGAPNAEFNDCTFNCDGKALLLYGTVNTNLTVDGCVFNDNGGLDALKAAIEIGNDYGTSYNLVVNKTTVNGFAINDKGINTNSTLWANKNSMGTDKLNVVIDGVDVY